MICDFCKKNEASIHLIKVQDNKVEKVNICTECVSNMSLLSQEDFFDDFSQALLKIFGTDSKNDNQVKIKNIFNNLKIKFNSKCPYCGIDLKTIKRRGKVGCPYCYSEFSNDLLPIIKTMHGNLEYKGKIPVNASGKTKLEKSIRDLKKRLKNEIIIENFEAAARTRDQIKELEKNFYE